MNFEEQLAKGLEGAVVVMGIGNTSRGDDAAGSLVAQQVEASPDVCVIDAQDVPEDYVLRAANRHPSTIVLIDSVELGAAPGAIAFLTADQLADYWPSTHRMPLGSLMRILERETHARVVAIGIQPAQTEFLAPVTDGVAASVAHVAEILNGALARGHPGPREREVSA